MVGQIPDHTVAVLSLDEKSNTITLYDPNSSYTEDTYQIKQFNDAWNDSKNYLVTITSRNMELYTNIRTSIQQIKKTLHINSTIPESEVRHAIRWVMRDNPDIFWFAHQYHYDEASSTIHFQYTFSAERVKTIQKSINDVIENDFCIEYVKNLTRQEI